MARLTLSQIPPAWMTPGMDEASTRHGWVSRPAPESQLEYMDESCVMMYAPPLSPRPVNRVRHRSARTDQHPTGHYVAGEGGMPHGRACVWMWVGGVGGAGLRTTSNLVQNDAEAIVRPIPYAA